MWKEGDLVIGENYLRRAVAVGSAALRRDRQACLRELSDSVVQTPNFGKRIDAVRRPMRESRRKRLGIAQSFYVDVGKPATSSTASTEACLAVWVVDPKPVAPTPTRTVSEPTEASAKSTEASATANASPRGTIIVLHGYRDGPAWMLHKARGLAKDGYRAVVISLRGHSDSTGDYHAFGFQEKYDVRQVIDELDRRGLIAGKLGIWGVSYGSTTALETAAIDPRIEAVMAMAGFSSMRAVTPHYLRVLAPFLAVSTSEAYLQKVITEAGQTAGFDPDHASAVSSIGQIHSPVLLMHGTWDWLVPVRHAHKLYAAANAQTKLMLVPRFGHIALILDPGGGLTRQAHAWFDRHLTDSAPTADSASRTHDNLTPIAKPPAT